MKRSDFHRRTAALALAFAALGPGAALPAAAATETPLAGGGGGRPFEQRGGPDSRIDHIVVHAGRVVDAVGVAIVAPSGAGPQPVVLAGGAGGGAAVFRLEPGERLTGLRGGAASVVEWIQFRTDRRLSPVYGTPGQAPPFDIAVPGGHVADGLVGRAGQYVDAIGLSLVPRLGAIGRVQTQRADEHRAVVARLDGDVRLSSSLSSVTLRFRLLAPAAPDVALGARRLGPGECFRQGEADVRQAPRRAAAIEQKVEFGGLARNTVYRYAIALGGGRCANGPAPTATIID